MSTDFKSVLVAATGLAVEYKKGAGTKNPAWKDAVISLQIAFNAYEGKREDRSAVEQNIYTAARAFCAIDQRIPADISRYGGTLDDLCAELLQYHQAMNAVSGPTVIKTKSPVLDPDIPVQAGATVQVVLPPYVAEALDAAILPEEWANTSAWGVIHGARQVIEWFVNSSESVSDLAFTDLVLNLADAWKTYQDGGETMEPKLSDSQKASVTDFLKAHRAMRMLGDPLAPSMAVLTAAFSPVAFEQAEPEVEEEDPYAEEPYLYILMRNDLASMNAGKAVAQGTHAANQMVFEAMKRMREEPSTRRGTQSAGRLNWNLVDKWQKLANGFGTCICVAVTEEQMRVSVSGALEAGLHAGITHDPSYPLKDGASFHLLPLDTCAYIFGKKGDCKPFTRFPLMP